MRALAPTIRARRLLLPATTLAGLAVGALALAQPAALTPEQVVARIGEQAITVRDLQGAMRRLPPHQLRALGGTPDEIRHGVLDALVADQVLAQGAVAEGLDRAPDVQSMRKARLAKELLASLRAELAAGPDVSADEVKSFYEQNKERYQSERTLQLWWIVVPSREQAQQVLDTIRDDPAYRKDPVKGWADLCEKLSVDEATKHSKGELERVRADGSTSRPGVRVSPAIVQAANKVPDGEVVPEPIPDGDRWVVLQRRGTQQAEPRGLESEAPNIRRLLLQRRHEEQVRSLLDRLRAEAHVESHPERADLLDVTSGEGAEIVPARRPGGLPRERRASAGSPRPVGPPNQLR